MDTRERPADLAISVYDSIDLPSCVWGVSSISQLQSDVSNRTSTSYIHIQYVVLFSGWNCLSFCTSLVFLAMEPYKVTEQVG